MSLMSRSTIVIPPASGRNGMRYAGRSVAASTPISRPWNAPRSATISCLSSLMLRAHRRANLNAASLASPPELQKNTRDANDRSTSFCANACTGAVWYRFDVCTSPSEAACSAARKPGSL
jgi:hypothetical protein